MAYLPDIHSYLDLWVWSESSLGTFWKDKNPKFHHVANTDSDQTVWIGCTDCLSLGWAHMSESTFSHVMAEKKLPATSWQNQQNSMCTQRRLVGLIIYPVWSESSLSAWRRLESLATHWAHSKKTDQTGQMARCPGCSDFLLGTQSLFWFCHEAAQSCTYERSTSLVNGYISKGYHSGLKWFASLLNEVYSQLQISHRYWYFSYLSTKTC